MVTAKSYGLEGISGRAKRNRCFIGSADIPVNHLAPVTGPMLDKLPAQTHCRRAAGRSTST
jgi:hypothetical protein